MAAEHLEKRIGDRWVLRDVSLDVDAGSSLAILGPNGAGKTTLLKILSGIWAPSAGALWRFGQKVTEARPDPRIAFLGHRSFLYPALSARENLLFYAKLWNLDQPQRRVNDALRQVGLTWSQDDPVRSYSRGMVQRAAIARALLTSPRLLLMDEPYTGLDIRGQALLDTLLTEFVAKGGALILITHQVDEALRSAQGVSILRSGRIVWWDWTENWSPERLLQHYDHWLSGGGV